MKTGHKMIALAIWIVALVTIGIWLRPISFTNGYLYARMFLMGAQSRLVSADGIRIHYDVLGPKDGSAVVLVHGLGGHGEDWLNLSRYLVRTGSRVYLIDLPGFGRSERPANFSYSVRDQADAVSHFLEALGLKQVDLGGWSMGGWIVQLVADEHPERIHKLILFDSAGLRQMPTWDVHLFSPNTVEQFHQLEDLLIPNPPAIPDFVSRDFVRLSQRNAWIKNRAIQSMLTGNDATDELLSRLKMPVLIVWDKDDQVFPLSHGQAMHNLVRQSQLEVVQGCGHLAVIECASQIAPGLVDFLKN
jgi:pimeloyl-ACP methyl ester carboxylesterase